MCGYVILQSERKDEDYNNNFVNTSDICEKCIENIVLFKHLLDDDQFINCLIECRLILIRTDVTHLNDI